MNDKQLTVRIGYNYGQRAVYPVCDTAKKFAQLIGTKTFTDQARRQIEELGYTFTIQQEQL